MAKRQKIFCTAFELEKLREMYERGMRLEDIAKEFQCSIAAVSQTCARLGMWPRIFRRGKLPDAKPQKRVA